MLTTLSDLLYTTVSREGYPPLAALHTMIFSPMRPCRWRLLHRCDNLISPWGGRGVGYEITTRPIFAPNRLGAVSAVQCSAMRCAWCTLRLLTGLGAAGWVSPPVVRRGEPVCPGREAGRRASAAGPWAKPVLDEQRSARFGARTWMSVADFDRRQGWRRSKPIGACRGTNGCT